MKQKKKWSLGAVILALLLTLAKLVSLNIPSDDAGQDAVPMQQVQTQTQQEERTDDAKTESQQSDLPGTETVEEQKEESSVTAQNTDQEDAKPAQERQDDPLSDAQESVLTEESTDETTENETAETTETTLTFRNSKLLKQHYEKHGIEMGFDSPEEYEAAAAAVVTNPEALHKIEAEDGDDVYYVESTNEFVVVSTDGYLRTYFYPNSGIQYFNRQ